MSKVKKNDKSSPTKSIKNCPPGQEFVFVTPRGKEVGRAKNIIEFIRQVKSVPLESILYHANGNHFSSWLDVIGEKTVAKRVSSIKGNDEKVRLDIIRCI